MPSSILPGYQRKSIVGRKNALKGKNNGGVPLGYLLDKKAQKLVIDPVTAPLVVEVFEKYADGKTVRSIVEDFNTRGLRTKKGQPFNINSTAVTNRDGRIGGRL